MALSKHLKFFWGVGNFGEGAALTLYGLYFTYFLTDIACFSIKTVGVILLVSGLFSTFIAAPVSGIIIDGTKQMRWGRLRSWLLITPLAVMLFYPVMFVKTTDILTNAILVTVAYFFYSTACNIGVTANYALIPIVMRDEKDKITLTSNRMTYTNAGSLIWGYLAPILLLVFLKFLSGNSSYMLLAFLTGTILLFGYLAHFRWSEQFENKQNKKQDVERGITIRKMFETLIHTPFLLPAMIGDMASTCVTFMLPTLAVYYFNNVLCQPALLALFMLITGIGGVLGAYCSRFVLKKIEIRTALLIIYPTISVLLFSLKFYAYMPVLFITVNTIVRFFVGMTQPIESNLYIDTALYSEYKNGIKADATILNMSQICGKLTMLVKNMIISTCLLAIGYQAGATSETIKTGIINAYCIVPAIIPLVGWGALFFFYKLTRESVEKMRKILNLRTTAL
jgi:GPH family glycoside/pentoside/hexuronide:cation symporter